MTNKTVTQKVLAMLEMGHIPSDVQEHFKLSDKAMEKHMEIIKEINRKYLSYMATHGYNIAYKQDIDALNRTAATLESTILKLKERVDAGDLKWSYALTNAITQHNKNRELHSQMINQAPMVESFRQFVQDNIAKPSSKDKLQQNVLAFLPS